MSVTGTGGGAGSGTISSSTNIGAYVVGGAGKITAGNLGTVTVVGNGGNTSGTGGTNHGIQVRNGGEIQSGRGVTVRGVPFDLESFTTKDEDDLKFLLELTSDGELSFVALSFVQAAKDILKVKHFIHQWYRNPLAPVPAT